MDVASDEEIECLSVDVASNSSRLLPSNLIGIIVDSNIRSLRVDTPNVLLLLSYRELIHVLADEKLIVDSSRMIEADASDCGAFVCAFTEYVIHGRYIPKEIDIDCVRMRYGALLWDYEKRKLEAGIKDNTTEKVGRLFEKEKRKRRHQK
ncbi:hypothetical protein T459_22982 [Capsicum annuum]|uniref:Ubiquitin-like protease family profile domain-containing protein n=1 Tax=Capsicum annuum TaxID=4072 RepID=A0A2G2YR17_CAPAN|nr:hypothetical protein T459_22982 [Capsicum annuum]